MILLALKEIQAKTETETGTRKLGNKCAALGLFSIIMAWLSARLENVMRMWN